jgi:hypothetical protein
LVRAQSETAPIDGAVCTLKDFEKCRCLGAALNHVVVSTADGDDSRLRIYREKACRKRLHPSNDPLDGLKSPECRV